MIKRLHNQRTSLLPLRSRRDRILRKLSSLQRRRTREETAKPSVKENAEKAAKEASEEDESEDGGFYPEAEGRFGRGNQGGQGAAEGGNEEAEFFLERLQ